MTEPEDGPRAQEDLARALRPLYAPPPGSEYWELLHARIVARVPAARADPRPTGP